MHVAAAEDLLHRGLIASFCRLHIGAFRRLDAKRICHILLRPEEACRDYKNLTRQLLLAARHLCHLPPAGLRILLKPESDRLHRAQISILVLEKFLDRRLVDPRVMPEQRDCLLLAVVGLADFRPLRPRIVRRALVRCLRHHLNGRHGLAAMADRGTGAVISRIASADNHNVLPLRLDILSILEMGIKQAFRIPCKEIDRKIDSLCIASGSLQVSCLLRPAGKHDGIVLLQKGLRLDILPDIHTGQEGDALLLHDADLAVYDLLLQLHVRDPVHQKAPDAVIALIHRHLMTSVIQHIRTGKP